MNKMKTLLNTRWKVALFVVAILFLLYVLTLLPTIYFTVFGN
jgi:hypothetical protein